MADDRAFNPNRVVGPATKPEYNGPDLTIPRVTVAGRTAPLRDLSWLLTNAKHATKVVLDQSPDPKAEAIMRVEGVHPETGAFMYQAGFASRNVARDWADRHLSHVGNRENRLRDGGY